MTWGERNAAEVVANERNLRKGSVVTTGREDAAEIRCE